MRPITAAQKIAILERRVATLEKQAIFSTISIVKKQLPHKNAVKRVILSEHPNPKNIRRIIDQVSREMGKSETKAVLKIINSQNRTFKDRVEACLSYNQDPEGWVSENMGGFGGRVAFDPVALTFASVTALLVGVTWFSLKSIFTFRQAGVRNKIWGMVVVALFGALSLSPQAPNGVVPMSQDQLTHEQYPVQRQQSQTTNQKEALASILAQVKSSKEVKAIRIKSTHGNKGYLATIYEIKTDFDTHSLEVLMSGNQVHVNFNGLEAYDGSINNSTPRLIKKEVESFLKKETLNLNRINQNFKDLNSQMSQDPFPVWLH